MGAGISIREAARRLGLAEGSVRNRIRNGKLSACILPDGTIDPHTFEAEFNNGTDPSKQRGNTGKAAKVPTKEVGTFAAMKTAKLAIELQSAKIDLDVKNGKLISRDDAARAVRDLMRSFRDNMLNFGARHGPDIADRFQLPVGEFVGELEKKIRESLAEFSDAPNPYDRGQSG